jgi:predicted glutamine amidotransferase
MCGLVGLFGPGVNSMRSDLMRWLLHYDVARGEDSTGVAIVSSKGVLLLKEVGHPHRLYSRFSDVFSGTGRMYSQLFTKMDTFLLMGHNRKSTVGATNVANAHPYIVGRLVGAHNGTLDRGVVRMENKTDSQQFYEKLAEKEYNFPETVKEFTGAAAFTYYDTEEETFNLYRNDDRTLWYLFSNDRRVLVYASERRILEQSIDSGKENSIFDIKNAVLLPTDRLHSFKIENGRILLEQTEAVLTPKYKTVYVGVSQTNFRGGAGYSGGTSRRSYFDRVQKKAPIGSSKADTTIYNDSGWIDVDKLDNEEIEKSLSEGCQLCQTSLELADHMNGNVKWLARDTPLCVSCAGDWSR